MVRNIIFSFMLISVFAFSVCFASEQDEIALLEAQNQTILSEIKFGESLLQLLPYKQMVLRQKYEENQKKVFELKQGIEKKKDDIGSTRP